MVGVVAALALGLSATAAVAGGGGTVSWTGQGKDSVGVCTNDQSPFLHWIFTEGGSGSVSKATLTLGGSGSGDYSMSQHGNSWTVDTGYYDLNSLTAHVTYEGELGNGTANLVISDGCYNETTVPAGGIIGSIGAALAAGIALLFLQTRRRRRRAAVAGP